MSGPFSPQTYPASRLNEPTGQLRLITIEPTNDDSSVIKCSLQTHDLADVPEYEGLSYFWGNELACRSIELNGCSYKIRPNLYQALAHLRLADVPRRIWIDAVCINQDDLSERSSQVRLMSHIYKNARQVIVWLGVEADNSSLAISLIRKWSQIPMDGLRENLTSMKNDSVMFDQVAFEALAQILARPWWTRIWGYQEYVLAKKVLFHCGAEQFTADSLADAVLIWNELRDHGAAYELQLEHHRCLAGAYTNQFPLINAHHIYLNTGRKVTAWERYTNLTDMSRVTHMYDSTDPRDKVYALLAFDEDRSMEMLQPDYGSTIKDVYYDFAVRCLSSATKLRILQSAGIGHGHGTPIPTDLACPSWMPDLRSTLDCGMSLLHWGFHAAGNLPSNYTLNEQDHILTCQGVLVDTVTHIFPNTLHDEQMVNLDWIDAIKTLPQDHPTGTPLLQVLFRTLILDQTEYTHGVTQFGNVENRNSFFSFLVGFILLYGMLGEEKIRQAEKEEGVLRKLLRGSSLASYFACFWIVYTGQQLEDLPLEQNLRVGLLRANEATQWLASLREAMGGDEIDNDKMMHFVQKLYARMYQTTQARALVATKRGYIGLGPRHVKEGDHLCCIFGCESPFILRPLENSSQVQLVGQSYAYGLMHGEGVKAMGAHGSDQQHFEII